MNKELRLVVFSATWCQPCKNYKPIAEKVCAEEGVEYEVADIQEKSLLAQKLNIRAVPTTTLWRGDELVETRSGALSAAVLKEFIKGHRNEDDQSA